MTACMHRSEIGDENISKSYVSRILLLYDGVYTSVTEISESEGIDKSYISRILRLALLAPDIIETVLEGRSDQTLMLETLERPLPASWEEQRDQLC